MKFTTIPMPPDLIGKRFHDLTVLALEGEWVGASRSLVRVRCERCGEESVILYCKLGQTKSCQCTRRKSLAKGKEQQYKLSYNGSSVAAITNRAVNKNSATGITGVSQMADMKYRAYITFQRRQYYLGLYVTIEAAALARKKAEQRIYGDFLAWYALEHPEEWAQYETRKKKQQEESAEKQRQKLLAQEARREERERKRQSNVPQRRICAHCGAEYTGSKYSCLCPACASDSKLNAVFRIHTCHMCGVSFQGGPRAWYCSECLAERQKKAEAASRAKAKAGLCRPMGSTDLCAVCGNPYVVKSGVQKYCPDCAHAAIAAAKREAWKRTYAQKKDELNAKRNAVRKARGKERTQGV